MSRAAAAATSLAFLAALWLPAAAQAQVGPQPDASAGGSAVTGSDPAGLLEAVRVGYDGQVPPARYPAPVWVTLRHPGGEETLRLEVVASGAGAARSAAQVELPPGAVRRLGLAVAVEDELLVEVRRGGERVAHRQVTRLLTLDLERHLLRIDGRPLDEQQAGGSRRDAPSLRLSSVAPADAPTEAACYAAFGAVLLHGVDPGAWGADRLAALLEYVAQGGTVLLPSATVRHPEAGALLERFPGAPRAEKRVGRPARIYGLGTGQAIAFRDDLLLAAFGEDAKAALTRQDLGDLVERLRGRSRVASLHHRWSGPAKEHPGFTTQALVVGFLVAYLLVVGPVLGLGLRRSSRRRLAVGAIAAIGGFTLLAPLVALAVRSGDGRVVVREAVRVLPDGSALALGEVTCLSGGADRYQVRVASDPARLGASGRTELAVTRLPAGSRSRRQWTGSRWRSEPPRLPSVRTRRGASVEHPLQLSPWGQRSFSTVQVLSGLPPLEAVQAENPQRGGVVRLTNTTGTTLERVIVVADGVELSRTAPYAPVGRLEPGESRLVPLPARRGRMGGVLRGKRPSWAEALGIPEDYVAWGTAFGEHLSSGPQRYLVVSRSAGLLRADGDDVEAHLQALRIDPVAAPSSTQRGYLGVVIEAGARYATGPDSETVEVRVARVAPGSPAELAGFEAGMTIDAFDGEHLESPQHLRQLLLRTAAGQRVSLQVRGVGGVRTLTARLAPPPEER